MAIDKIFPRKISKSKDVRLRKKDEMTDALNVRASEDSAEMYGNGSNTITSAFAVSDVSGPDTVGSPPDTGMGGETSINAASGNSGVLKPVQGNSIVDFSDETVINTAAERNSTDPSMYKILGKVEDKANDRIFFFMWHANPAKHSIIMYGDAVEQPNGSFASDTLQNVITSSFLNFQVNSVVQGVVTHVSTSDVGTGVGQKTLLYFVDNYNEPRCIDVDRCLANDIPTSNEEIVEFISLCPRTPLVPVSTAWDYDSTRTISNFKNVRGFQFAYQNVYKNDVVSAFSIYSKLSINPAYLSQGADPTPEIEAYNKMLVRVPIQSGNVKYMKLYAREGNTGPWFFLADVDNGSGDVTIPAAQLQDGTTAIDRNYITYEFYNDQIVSFIPEEETFKQFDNVPQLADAIALSNDRLFLGNYVEGYDPVNANANIAPLYKDRPEDFSSLDILAVPEVRVIADQTGCPNRVMGYRIDLSGMSDIAAGTTLNLNITVRPDNNFHIYNSQASHHSSVFAVHEAANGKYDDKITNNNDQLLFDDQGANSYDPSKQYFGKVVPRTTSFGGMDMSIRDIGWDPVASATQTPQSNPSARWGAPDEDGIEVCYGTGASNPLILQAKTMNFGCRIFFEEDFSAEAARNVVAKVFSGTELVSAQTGQTAADFAPTVTTNYLVQSGATVLDSNVRASYAINCGLSNLSSIDGFNPDPNRSRICAVGDRSLIEDANPTGVPPSGYFIVNRASVTFRMTTIDDTAVFDPQKTFNDGTLVDDLLGTEMSTQNYSKDIFVALDLEDIRNPQVFTCLPDIVGGLSPTIFGITANLLDYAADAPGPTGSQSFTSLTNEGYEPAQLSEGIERYIIPGTNENVGGYTRTPYRMSHKVKQWICVSASYMQNQVLRNSGTSAGTLLNRFDQFMAEDYRKILQGDFIGGYSMDYAGGAVSRSYPNGLQPEQEFNDPLSIAWDTYDYDFSSADIVVQQLRRLFGVLKLPGQSAVFEDTGGGPTSGINDNFGPLAALSGTGPTAPATGVAGPAGTVGYNGTLVCTPLRAVLAARELGTTLPEASLAEQGSTLRADVLAYTIVDGESGPGGNKQQSSIPPSVVRDGVMYYVFGAGLNGASASSLVNEFNINGSAPSISALSLNVDEFGYAEIDFPANRGLGYLMNTFEFYLAQPDYARWWHGLSAAVGAQDFAYPIGSVAAHYDGQVFGDGGDNNINLNADDAYTGDFGPETPLPNPRPIRSGLYKLIGANVVGENASGDEVFQSNGLGIRANLGWYRLYIPHAEIVQQISFIQTSGDGQDTRSFKTNATHNFGIVYSDFYGRQSPVYPLGSSFVPPYETQSVSNSDRGGAVQMQIQITNQPPEWAYSYQIVYGGNTSIEDFIQYSAAGAYISAANSSVDGADDLGAVSTANIYVSLNYLQGNSDVSYTDAFGARNDEGLNRLWDFQPGDKLKVISYYEGGNRKFAANVVFDVVNQVQLGAEDNPLAPFQSGEDVSKRLQGEFLVLKNNPYANGFNVAAIREGQDLWNNRCIIEIYRPASSSKTGEKPFYEIGESYRVLRNGTEVNVGTEEDPLLETTYTYTHELNPITIREGDVYFRRMPVNLPPSAGNYPNLVNDEGSSQPAFFSYFLESPRFNDLISGARQTNFGRPKIIQNQATKVRRASSVVYSDQNDYTANPLKLNSFNSTTFNFKDIPNAYGEIACLIDYNEGLFVLQKNKASYLPINRTILSDVSGNDSVIASQKVVGTQKFYSGDYGCDTNPESVVVVGNTIYWCNKRMREVYKFNPSSGIQVISNMGMKSYFDRLFGQAQNMYRMSGGPVRCVGGYDPRNEEYILSVYNQITFNWSPNYALSQPDADPIQDTYEPPEVLGDLTAEEEAALAEALLEAQIANGQLTATIANLQAELASLYAQLNEETTINPGPNNPNISDLFEEIFDLEQELATQVPVLQANIDAEVSLHESIVATALSAVQSANNEIANLSKTGFIQSTANLYTLPSNPQVEYDADDLKDYFSAAVERIQTNLLTTHNAATTQVELRNGELYTFMIGYGAGPNPEPGSYIEVNGIDALLAERDFATTLRSDINTYQIEATTELIDKVEEQSQEITGLQFDKQTLLSQIGTIAVALDSLKGPDLDKPREDIVDVSYADQDQVDFFKQADFDNANNTVATGVNDFIKLAAQAHASGNSNQIYDLILNGDTVISGLGTNALQQYFNVGLEYNFYNPNKLRRNADDLEAVALQSTRDVLVGALNNTVASIGNALTDQGGANAAEVLNTLTSAGIGPVLAGLLLDPTSTPGAIISQIDGDGDGFVSAEEAETALPTNLLAAAFTGFAAEETITVNVEGVATTSNQVWEQLRAPIGEVFDDILDVSEEIGVFDSDSSYAAGFTSGDIGIVQELRDFFNSVDFTDPNDTAAVVQRINQLKNRISGADAGDVNIIDALRTYQKGLADAIQPVSDKRFHTDPFIGQDPQLGPNELRKWVGQSGYRVGTNYGPYRNSFQGKVLQAIYDIDFAIDVAKEFQDLFTFEQRPSNITEVLSSTARNPNIIGQVPDDATGPQGNPILFTGKSGVTAGDVLRGASVVGKTAAGQNYLGQSTLYAFSSAMNTVNQRIKELGEYAAGLIDAGVTGDTSQTNVSYRTPLNKQGLSILQPDVDGSLIGSSQAPYPASVRNLRLNLDSSTAQDIEGAFNYEAGSGVARPVVEQMLLGIISPTSNYFDPDYLDFIVQNYVTYGNLGYDQTAKADLNGDGAVATADLLEFLAQFGQQVFADMPSDIVLSFVSDDDPDAQLQNVLNAFNNYASFADFQFAPTSLGQVISNKLDEIFGSGGSPVVVTGTGADTFDPISVDGGGVIDIDDNTETFDPNDFFTGTNPISN
jgi:hypothetical protein